MQSRGLMNGLSVDVEDWFQVGAFDNVIAREDWSGLSDRVERNVMEILSLFDEAGTIMNEGSAKFFQTFLDTFIGWIERQRGKVVRGLDMLEREVPRFNRQVTIGQIGVGCCLGYLDFRYGTKEDWRIGRPLLGDWYSMFMTRPSMVATWPGLTDTGR